MRALFPGAGNRLRDGGASVDGSDVLDDTTLAVAVGAPGLDAGKEPASDASHASAGDASRRRLQGEDNDMSGNSTAEEEVSSYPPDLFSEDQLNQGAIVLHCVGCLYTFLALSIVCDTFFVPALEVLIEVMELSDDVAGATLMASGGSAPELATSFVGTHLARNSVGFGTIVGSAIFNVLAVLAACAVFAPTGEFAPHRTPPQCSAMQWKSVVGSQSRRTLCPTLSLRPYDALQCWCSPGGPFSATRPATVSGWLCSTRVLSTERSSGGKH